jgi:hypothetical protein
MHKSATKCNETLGKWCKNKHGASKIIDTFETYHRFKKRSFNGVPIHATPAQEKVKGGKRYIHEEPR